MKKLITICVVIGVLFAATIEVQAATYGVTSRQDLAGDDYVDWGQQGYGTPYYVGGHFVGGPYVQIPVPAFSEGGIGLNVANPPYNGSLLSMAIRQQSLSWFGCFAPGDVVIGNQWDVSDTLRPGPTPDYDITNIGPGPMTIHFDVPVYGLGTQINKWQYFAGTFNAIIEAFDSNWNTLGHVSFNNLQFTRSADNSAPFIGILSDTANISHVVIATGRSAHMINQLDLVTVQPTIPGTAIPSSPGTAGGVVLVKKGANANDPAIPDTTAGAMLVTSETFLGSEYTIADLSVDSVVQTNAFTGDIHYNGNSQLLLHLPANPIIWGDYALLPMDVQIDGAPATLADLDGQTVKQLTIITNRGSGFVPELNEYHLTFQRVVSATLSNNNGGGGQQTATPVEFEGSIDSIAAIDNALEVTVGNVTLTVDSQTTITVNGQTAGLEDLQVGYKVAGMYDSSNNHATEIKAEGEGGGGGGNGGGGNGGGGGGGQQTAKPKKFEGFIDSIAAVTDALEITVGKEGNFVTVTVDSQTSILINEQSASLDALAQQSGSKVKVKYDSSNNHATEIMVEGG